MADQKKYWKGLEELTESPGFVKAKNKEFAEEIPIDEFLGKQGQSTSNTSRRDFLKFMGFSVAAATLAACEAPVVKTIPYVIKPEEVTPGIDNWYASTYFDGQDYCSLLVKTRDGRPIKIEGNTMSNVTRGAANARVQSSVLSLYNAERLKGPMAGGKKATWEQVDKEITEKLAKGGNIRILTSTIISPSTKQIIADFTEKYSTAKHVSWDAVSFSGMMNANKASFGEASIPTYAFNKADVIVSIAADFLTNWLSPIEFSKQYAEGRKVGKDKKEMSRHIQFESILSVSGSNADTRVQIKPSEEGAVALGLYNAVAKQTGGSAVSAPAFSDAKINERIEKAAAELVKSKGKSVVVAGANNTSIQTVVNEINRMLGNYGADMPINPGRPCYLRQGSDEDFAALVSDMKSGKVDVLITYNVNPAYNSAKASGFADAFAKVPCKIVLSEVLDETASHANYVCPTHNYLEAWGDANPYAGQYSLAQPAIYPLFSKKFPRENVESKYEGTRHAQDNFLKWTGGDVTDYYTYLQQYWKKNILPEQSSDGGDYMFIDLWNKTLSSGVFEKAAGDDSEIKAQLSSPINVGDAASKIAAAPKGGIEVVLYEKTGIGNGNHANNPWLQELPDPVSRVTWDNYVTMNPSEMKEKGYNLLLEDNREASLVTVSAGGVTLDKPLPVYPQPGQARGTIGIALGYGRTHAGKVANGVGHNVYALVQVVDGTFQYSVANATVTKVEGTYKLAATQTHHTMIGRPVLKETTLEEYKKDARAGNEEEKIPVMDGSKATDKSFKDVNLWDDFDKKEEVNMINNAGDQGLRWKMAIDLNSCIGCGACVVSCSAENNVPVVGKEEIMNVREMHWIRIDRYYSSDLTKAEAKKENMTESHRMYAMMDASADNPEVAFQPVMCQHCNHAPCETVCPVIATSHSSEGINMMVYNRCVGTKYCANNCPYKVRRFNWFNYYRDEKFLTVNPAQESNEMGRMVLNPDVVVRSRGVMEKCSFCLQRIQSGKLKAKLDSRTIKDGEVNPACAQSCPTQALVFGNGNDPESRVAKLMDDERNYLLLADLDTQPNVFYMTKVRNSEEAKLSE